MNWTSLNKYRIVFGDGQCFNPQKSDNWRIYSPELEHCWPVWPVAQIKLKREEIRENETFQASISTCCRQNFYKSSFGCVPHSESCLKECLYIKYKIKIYSICPFFFYIMVLVIIKTSRQKWECDKDSSAKTINKNTKF